MLSDTAMLQAFSETEFEREVRQFCSLRNIRTNFGQNVSVRKKIVRYLSGQFGLSELSEWFRTKKRVRMVSDKILSSPSVRCPTTGQSDKCPIVRIFSFRTSECPVRSVRTDGHQKMAFVRPCPCPIDSFIFRTQKSRFF